MLSSATYSIMISGLPQDLSKEELEAKLKERWSKFEYEIVYINYAYVIGDFMEKKQKVLKMEKYKRDILSWRENDPMAPPRK